VSQYLSEGETRAVLGYCVKKGRFAAVLCRAERFIQNLSEGTRLRGVKSGKALYPGKTYIAFMGFAQGT